MTCSAKYFVQTAKRLSTLELSLFGRFSTAETNVRFPAAEQVLKCRLLVQEQGK